MPDPVDAHEQRVSDAEIAIVADWIPVAREHGLTQPLSASFIALGLPAIHLRDRIQLVLEEMERRGLVERYEPHLDHLIGSPRYRETEAIGARS
jgi:hypothetical protein